MGKIVWENPELQAAADRFDAALAYCRKHAEAVGDDDESAWWAHRRDETLDEVGRSPEAERAAGSAVRVDPVGQGIGGGADGETLD